MRVGPISGDPLQVPRELAWPGVREVSAASSQRGMDLVVLSSPAYEATAGKPAEFESAYDIAGPGASGRMNITKGSAPGTVRIVVDLQAATGDPIHLDAQVRSTWAQAVAGGPGENVEQATRLVEAIARIAGIEGQTTVRVTTGASANAGPAVGHGVREALHTARLTRIEGQGQPAQRHFEPPSMGRPAAPADRAKDPYGKWGAPIRGPVRPVYPQVWLPAEYPPPIDPPSLLAEVRGEGKAAGTAKPRTPAKGAA